MLFPDLAQVLVTLLDEKLNTFHCEVQTLHLHIGGDLQLPVRESKYVHPSREEQEQATAASHRWQHSRPHEF